MKCNKCNKENRKEARFCKWCGAPIAAQAGKKSAVKKARSGTPPDNLIEKGDIPSQLESIVAKAKGKADFCRRNGIRERMQLSFVITGASGTGKTEVAHTIARMLHKAGIAKAEKPVTVNPVNFNDWIENIEENENELANSVLIFEEAQKLVGDGDATGINGIDYILAPIRRWRDQSDKPIVILTGDKNLQKYFSDYRQAASAINYFFATESLTVDGLLEIAVGILSEKYKRTLTDEATEKLRRIFLYDRRNPEEALGEEGHDAAARAYRIDLSAVEAAEFGNVLGAEHVNGKEFIPKTIEEVMAEFDRYVGVEDVKAAIRSIANSIEEDVKAGKEPRIMHHYRFLGNPGTGKTTMARLFADALNALGALPVGQLVEVSKEQLVSGYVGETPKLVAEQFQKAMGGVLFIDEAYQLGNDSHGKDAVDTILTLAENNKGKLVVIIAGYVKEMNEFYQLNTGLASRFDKDIYFRDYTPEELEEIFRRMVKATDGLALSADADEGLNTFFKKMVMSSHGNFGNAREVRNAFQEASERRNDRLKADPSSAKEMTLRDIEGEDPDAQKSIDEILASLDDLVGMEGVKEQLADIAANVQISRLQMAEAGSDPELFNIHIAITGNPGTGKTVVAKRLGEIFKSIGLLSRGHVVERERKTLLDSYANSAGINMDKAVDEALGGVLFIDEAYNLIPMKNPAEKDNSGTEAVEALMTRMVKDAGKFVTVIAGYKNEIEEFIANANPGLSSRFTHRIHIDDYTPAQLSEIFMRQASALKFRFTDEAKALLMRKMEEMVTAKDRNFGNARTALQLFAKTRERMSKRLRARLHERLTTEELLTVEAQDIPYDPPKKVDIAECLRELDRLEGLESVKKEIRDLADTITVEQERAALEGRQPKITLDHYLFLGNPGTGKTTVARIMGNIFFSLGLLPSNKLIEVKPSDMIAGYIGQTAPKTRQIIERGLGGVLFIDEAYGLNDGGFGSKDSMPELLTLLNDYRSRMVCIAAGYPREMAEWINLNSGLERRFTKVLHFEDYSDEELSRIFLNIVKGNGMRLTDGAEDEMRRYFRVLVYNKGANFGNAAEAVKYFNRVKIRQGARLRQIMHSPGFSREELYLLKPEDMITD